MLPDFRIRQRDYLLEISRSITEELDLDKVLARIVRVSTELLAGAAGLIALRDDQGEWQVAATYGIPREFVRRIQPLIEEIPHQGDRAETALPEVTRRLQRLTQTASMGLLTGVGLPMISAGEIVGVIFIFRSYRGGFSNEDRRLLSAFASQAAIAVSNARLFTQVAREKTELDAVLDASADGIFILDPSLNFTRFNRSCSKITGYSSDEVIGADHNAIINWENQETGISFEEAQADGWPDGTNAILTIEGQLQRKNGGTISVGITYAPTFLEAGSLLSIVANMRDMTKIKEAEDLKSTFISIISHELRTPVALIKGYVGTLRREDAAWDPVVVKDSLAVIEEEADHLASLIDDLLDASRIQAGGLEFTISDIDIAQISIILIERFRKASSRYNFDVKFQSKFPIILGDEERLTQVLSNLLSNAVKYSEPGSSIKLEGSYTDTDILVCVQDEGQGIPAEDRERVFERFYRAIPTSHSTTGTGLGLYLAKAVIEAHHGRIWVEKSDPTGTQVCFSLPREQSLENR
jgi:PAS domain S-box-containing protein